MRSIELYRSRQPATLPFPTFQRVGQGGELHSFALGRKNWIHIGSQQAGPKVAAILSIVESCRRLKIPTREYLAAVLPGLADCST